ncbi:MAG: RNA polymerase sigma factor [Planctomycetota bacterium]
MTATGTDAELIDRARQGDRAAWRALLERHLPALGAYIGARLRRPEVVDDLLVEASALAWRHLDTLQDAGDLPRWLRKMGANVALRWHKSNPHESLAAVVGTDRIRRGSPDAVDADGIQALDAAIGRLKADQRMAIEQRFRGGLRDAALWEVLHVDGVEGLELLHTSLRALDRQLGDALP